MGLGIRDEGLGFRVKTCPSRPEQPPLVQDLGLGVKGLGFSVQGPGFRVWG